MRDVVYEVAAAGISALLITGIIPVCTTAGTVFWTSHDLNFQGAGSVPKYATEHIAPGDMGLVTHVTPSPNRTVCVPVAPIGSSAAATRTHAVTVGTATVDTAIGAVGIAGLVASGARTLTVTGTVPAEAVPGVATERCAAGVTGPGTASMAGVVWAGASTAADGTVSVAAAEAAEEMVAEVVAIPAPGIAAAMTTPVVSSAAPVPPPHAVSNAANKQPKVRSGFMWRS